MSTALLDAAQANDDNEPSEWFAVEDVEPSPTWGPFLPWRAIKAICELTRGNTQHVAIMIARVTPRDGKSFVVQKELAVAIGRGPKIIRAAINELHTIGILAKAKRTMGGFQIVWGQVAYGITDGDVVGRRTEKASSQWRTKLRDALRNVLAPVYRIRLAKRYPLSIGADSPDAYQLSILTQSGQGRILDNLTYFAEKAGMLDAAPAEIIIKPLDRWLQREGNGKFLVRRRHPLEKFAEDIGEVVGQILGSQEKRANDPSQPSGPRRAAPKVSSDEYNANIAAMKAALENLPADIKKHVSYRRAS